MSADAVTVQLPDELLAAIAERVAAILADHAAPATAADGWLRGANEIAAYIGAPRSRVFALASAGRIPVERDGSALLAKRATLDAWIRSGGGKRP